MLGSVFLMKRNPNVTADRSKNRKARFNAPSHKRRLLMSAHLSKDLQKQYGVRSLPVREGDTIMVMRGHQKEKSGVVNQVYRKKWFIYTDKIIREKSKGQTVSIAIRPNDCQLTDLKLDSSRKRLIEQRKQKRDHAKHREVNMV